MRNQTLIIGTLAVAGALSFSSGASAQINGWLEQRASYNDEYRQSYYDSRRIAYDNGYREGLRDGESAARGRRPFDVQREKDWRKADSGYTRSYGDKDRYRDNFRVGYSDGYRSGYDRVYNGRDPYDRRRPRGDDRYGYPNSYPYPSRDSYPYPSRAPYPQGRDYGYGAANIAFQNGVNDGYEKGLDDAKDRRIPDARRQKWYREGDRHYEGRYGSKDLYKEQYRRGFLEGYDRAYRDARRY